MPLGKDLELAKAAYMITRDLVKVKPGQTVLITTDSANDWRPAEEIAKASEALGAKTMVAWHSTPDGYGKVADPKLPDCLKAAVVETDVWIELNSQWLLYCTAWEQAMKKNRARYLFLGGLDTDRIIRCIGRTDLELQDKFQTRVVELTKKARKMRITTPAGTDVSFENAPKRPVNSELWADQPGPHFLLGQMSWAPIEKSINGTIVFDGSYSGGGPAELGVLKEPITYVVKEGRVAEILGGEEARTIRKWLEAFNDPRMYYIAHACYGFNCGCKLTGLCTEDERVWGCTEWGIGYQGPMLGGALGDAASHADGIGLNSSVWLDGQLMMEEGRLVDPVLADLAHKMGKQ